MNTPLHNILIVEDTHEDRRIYQHMLSRQSDFPCRMTIAKTGQEGLVCVQRVQPTCILLDYLLPDMDGLHFLRTLKEQLTDLPAIVVLTSQSSVSVAVEAMKLGAQDYLDKRSVTEDRLVRTVMNATMRVALQRELHLQTKRLQEQEAQYRTLVEGSIQGLYIHQQAMIEFANPAMARLLRYDSPQELVGQHYEVTVAPHERPRLESYRLAQLEGALVPSQYEYQGLCKDGTPVWLECVVSPVSWKLGEALMVAFVDISARKQAEQDLLRARKLESVGVLAGGIAHDFNNLLTGVLANVSLAKHLAVGQTKLVTRLDQAEKACEKASTLTQQLLTFADGGAPIRQPVSVVSLIRESVDFALHGSPVRADLDIAADLWLAHVDAGQMHQVIHNVVLNAAQAMPEGGVVEVRADNWVVEPQAVFALEAGRYIRLRVADHGPGMTAQVRANLFDPYFTTKDRGSGLGLTIAHAIVKKHDGYIAVDSRLGVGSAFTIYLPAAERPAVTQVTTDVSANDGAHILVLDDEDYILDLLREMLGGLGYTVTCSQDGVEVLAAYRQAIAENRPVARGDSRYHDSRWYGGL